MVFVMLLWEVFQVANWTFFVPLNRGLSYVFIFIHYIYIRLFIYLFIYLFIGITWNSNAKRF